MRLSWMMVFHAARSLWKWSGENASWKSGGRGCVSAAKGEMRTGSLLSSGKRRAQEVLARAVGSHGQDLGLRGPRRGEEDRGGGECVTSASTLRSDEGESLRVAVVASKIGRRNTEQR